MVMIGGETAPSEPLDSTQGNNGRLLQAGISQRALPVDHFSDEMRMARAKSSVAMRRRLMTTERPVIKDVAARVLRREIHDVKEAFGKYIKKTASRDDSGFDAWLTAFYQGHQEFVQKQFAPVITHYGELVAGAAGDEVATDGWTTELEQFVSQYLSSYAARHVGISEAEMKQMVQRALENAAQTDSDPIQALDDELSGWEDTRSDEIAMDESVRENNAVAKAVYIAAGFLELVWIALAGACDYCSSLNGQVVSITKNFLNAGEGYKPDGADRPLTPSGNVGHPPAHRACECMCAAWK
jgi:hypothetical protein